MKRIALFENTSKPESISWAEYTANKLRELGVECCAKLELISAFSSDIGEYIKPVPPNEFDKFADVLISFGGDGTILAAARTLLNTEIPIMGVNVGKLGFLAEFSVNDLENAILDLLKGNYRVVDRTVLETKENNKVVYALNDFTIEKKDSSRMITIQAYANDKYIGDYRADGIILTTPTGSTAYSLSCGGPIIAPSTQVFCITPISPHSLTLRPLIIPDTNEVKLKVYSSTGEASLVADGQFYRSLKNNEVVTFRKSDYRVKLIKPLNSTYYDLLRAKLLWAANVVGADFKKDK